MTGLPVPWLDLGGGASAPRGDRAQVQESVRRRPRVLPTSTAVLVEQAAAVGVVALRLSLVVQMVPAMVTGTEVSARPREYVALWSVAVVVTLLGAVVVAVRRRPLGAGLVYADVAVAAVLLVVAAGVVPVEHRIGSWVGWTAGYALTVACTAGVLRSLRGWALAIGVIVAGYLVYVGPLATGPALPTVVANALGYVVMAGTVRLIVWYLRRISLIADQAQAEVARLARLEEEHRAQLAMHDATTVMQLLADPTLPAALRAQLQTQAVAEVRRMRTYLRQGAVPVPSPVDVRRAGGLRAVVEEACEGFDDLGLDVRTELLDGVRVGPETAEALVPALRTVLHNVRRHAGATVVVVHGDVDDEPAPGGRRRWTIGVRDDGCGFDPARTAYGVGLGSQVVEELDRHGVDARITSAPGRGTCVELTRGRRVSPAVASSPPDASVSEAATRPRVVLVDDIAALRAALPALLDGVEFVGVYADAETLLAERPGADVALLDLKLANAHQPDAAQGPEVVRRVVAAGYRVCLYSQEERRFVLAACVAAGASGLVAKSEPIAVVAEVVERVAAGGVVLPPTLAGLAEVLVRRGNLRLLSPRQRQLLAGRARGKTYAEIGAELHLSESTLRGYWADLSVLVAEHLQTTSAADLEQAMGLAPGDLLGPRPA